MGKHPILHFPEAPHSLVKGWANTGLGDTVSLDLEAESYKSFVAQKLKFVQHDDEVPPRPRTAFDTSPKHWVYRVQQRIWLKFADEHEDWSEWMSIAIKYYLREHAAVKAMEQYVSSQRYSTARREFRVACAEHPTGQPFRHRRSVLNLPRSR